MMRTQFKLDAEFQIAKKNSEQRLVFGFASVALSRGQAVVDSEGDVITLEELEKMAYAFNERDLRPSGDMHQSPAFGELVESFVLTPEKMQQMGLVWKSEGDAVFGWWVGFRLPKEEFERVKRGERRMFSIEGTGNRRAID